MNRLVLTEVSVMQRNARDWLGLTGHNNDALVNNDGYASGDASEVQNENETPGGQLDMGNGLQIAIVRPRNFRDAAIVGEYFRQEIPVIINLEDLDNVLATRIIDFVSGLILGLCGDIERISRRTFLVVPAGATILTAHVGLAEEGFFNQALWLVNDSSVFSAGPDGDFAHETRSLRQPGQRSAQDPQPRPPARNPQPSRHDHPCRGRPSSGKWPPVPAEPPSTFSSCVATGRQSQR
jgi:cell division inhibitor SepF